MKISIGISSHKSFCEISLKELIPSLLVSGVPKEDIYVFIGGYETYENVVNEYNVNTYNVPHNSFDFTALVSIIELSIEKEYWFIIHDTCKVGSTFYQKLLKLCKPELMMRFTQEGRSMNMGIYSNNLIKLKKDKILNYKNTSKDLNSFKKKLIDDEDIFIKESKALCANVKKTSKPYDYYSTGTQRITEYYPDLDFYKIKSNWNRKDIYETKI
jgi:hypothetical protein